MKVKTHNNPTTLNVNGADHRCPVPTSPFNYLVNIIKGHNTIFSFGHFVQAVERNGKCKLTLGGNAYSENSKNL